ncbi:MAG: DUF2141 domain-containing protein [Proteobacteria bacterium]|nr:DUF2141 domain-containing protein [Pseudomonadota bacterium]MCP4918332.1 DUF2141 domain-containing protein [Pseudomonadota bacterium]
MTALFLVSLASAGEPVTLSIEFTELRSDDGQVVVHLYCDDAGYPKDPSKACETAVADVDGKKATVVFEQLARGVYAVSAVHDENVDGKLETFLGIPQEGVGMVGGSKGIPSFEDASIRVDGDAQLTGSMVYLL